MSQVIPWLVVLVYLVPIIGTLASMRRRAKSVWSVGESLRRLLPEDRIYRRIKGGMARYRGWREAHPIARYLNLDLLNLTCGKIEYAFGHLRDYTIGVFMMAAVTVDLTLMVFGEPHLRATRFPSLFYHGLFALLSLWSYRRHVATGLMMTEFMRVNPHVHPQEFFDHYYRRLGPATTPIPPKAAATVDPTNVSYLSGRPPRRSLWLLLHGIYDTGIFARSAYKALETIGPEYGREVFDVMASLWGSRMLQLFRSRLIVEGLEKFRSLPGKVVLVFNHKSHVDFVLNFFALSTARLASGRPVRPRYLAAKDHFVDNKLIYSVIGIGKLIETVDMVFVDRKGKGKDAIRDACQRLAEKEIEIAMYPQGTRAVANYGPSGERLDAGYYTTGTAASLKKDLGHLKKGCAYLAVDTAIAALTPVHLVFIGIDGTATLAPKGSFKPQTEATVRFTVGDVLTLEPSDVEGLEKPAEEGAENEAERRYQGLVERLQRGIDAGLVGALRLHERLTRRFLEEGRRLVPKEGLFALNRRLTEARRNGEDLPFILLDQIYALPPDEQELFLKEFSRRLLSPEDFSSLREKVTDQLFRHRGKELKTLARQERARKAS